MIPGTFDTGDCPLCSGSNECALAGGNVRETPCWCEHVQFPAELRVQIPLPMRDLACVCHGCVERVRRESAPGG